MVLKRQPTSLLITFYFSLLEILGMEIALLWHLNVKGQFFHMSGKIIVKNGTGKEEKKWQQTTFLVQVKKYICHRYPEKNKSEARLQICTMFKFFSEPKTNYSISYKPSSYWHFTVTMAPQTAFTSGIWAAPSQALPGEHSGFSS